MQPSKKLPAASLRSGKVHLRLIEHSDLPMTLKWRNKKHIRKWFFDSEVIAPEKHEEWFQKYFKKEGDFVFIIEEIVKFKKPVGQVSLYNIDWKEKVAEYGRLIIGEEDARGIGIAKEATEMLLSFAFIELELERVELEVMSSNKRAIGIYHACGFEEISDRDGVKRMTHSGSKHVVGV